MGVASSGRAEILAPAGQISVAFGCGIALDVALLKQCHRGTIMKVYGYCRVSTAEQANAGLSLLDQQQQITGYGMMKGWEIAELFVERGVSGSVALADRPEGQRMLSMLQPGD